MSMLKKSWGKAPLNTWFRQSVLLPLVSKDDADALQTFAITMSIAFVVIFMGLLPWLLTAAIPLWPAILSMLLMLLYFCKPSFLYYPYITWMVVASVLGFINTRLILALAYYLLIVPIGIIMQWRNGLQYKPYKLSESSWVGRNTTPTKENLKEPF